ncbi:MAG: Rrf2 family transcriptional regulator [Alphaproteobacteria bacterium]|nr:MAG: Rrf2 family transcriptional regulator [Alphaproteobacteria bacterium]
MLSMKAKYALKALGYLARKPDTRFGIERIAEAENIPYKFLEAILTELRKSNVIDSKRGAAGGVKLARAPKDISIGDVIRLMDGPIALLPCASITRYRACDDCPDEAACRLRQVMIDARLAIADVLDERTLADLASRSPLPSERRLTDDDLG